MEEERDSVSPPNDKFPLTDDDQDNADRLRKLRSRSRIGYYGLTAFVLITVLAIPNSRLLPPLSAKVRNFLGAAPPTEIIGVALIIYVFSALTLTLARIARGQSGYRGWSHLFYIASFYFFFAFSDGGNETYWAVFVSGLVIMGLENYQVRSWCAEQIKEELRKAKMKNLSSS